MAHILVSFSFLLLFYSCNPSANMTMQPNDPDKPDPTSVVDTATFGGGCFWCTEAIFTSLKGVVSVTPGYSGGFIPNPTYEQVCTGSTGHAEVIQVYFNPAHISYAQLLEIFWATHDPTTLNRQGNDIGTQYRSVIFTHNSEQNNIAENLKNELNETGAFPAPVVTAIESFSKFYPAEKYHEDYYARNRNSPYCRLVIQPKVDKAGTLFRDLQK